MGETVSRARPCAGFCAFRCASQTQRKLASEVLQSDEVRRILSHGRSPFHGRRKCLYTDTFSISETQIRLVKKVLDSEISKSIGFASQATHLFYFLESQKNAVHIPR